MLGDLLLKIEKLHEFIDDCVTSESLSLIDKDIILQNIRDIYIDASKISIGDFDADFDDDFENENIILFDSKVPLKVGEPICDDSFEEQTEEEIVSEERVDIEEAEELKESENENVDEPLEQEQVVYMSSANDNDLSLGITDYERELIIGELCDMNEERYSDLIDKLSSFTDLDEALIYISEEFSASQNSESAVLLADKMAERLS